MVERDYVFCSGERLFFLLWKDGCGIISSTRRLGSFLDVGIYVEAFLLLISLALSTVASDMPSWDSCLNQTLSEP